MIVKNRPGHVCDYAFTVAGIVAWEGASANSADKTYDLLADRLARFGRVTSRK